MAGTRYTTRIKKAIAIKRIDNSVRVMVKVIRETHIREIHLSISITGERGRVKDRKDGWGLTFIIFRVYLKMVKGLRLSRRRMA